jgi:hypothetical protein
MVGGTLYQRPIGQVWDLIVIMVTNRHCLGNCQNLQHCFVAAN